MQVAEETHTKEDIGIATYKNNFFDEMTNPDLEGIEIEYR